MTPVLCPTCQVDTWIVELPIVEEFTFDSESGQIVFIGTANAPDPYLKAAKCVPSGHPVRPYELINPDTAVDIERAIKKVLADPTGRLIFKPHEKYEVREATYVMSTVYNCLRCQGSEWVVGIPNTYSWLFNSRLGVLSLESDDGDDSSIEVVYARCIVCSLPEGGDGLVKIEKSFIESYERSFR
jgi:hypothetical protein